MFRLETVYQDSTGIDEITFTVTDPDDNSSSDNSLIKVLGETKPVLIMPEKIGFITGNKETINLDEYVADPEFSNGDLEWSWNGNIQIEIEYDKEDTTLSNPVYFTSSGGWIGYELVYFAVENPLGGSAIDSTIVFSVPGDGTPVAGGLDEVWVKAGYCDSLNLDLDNFYYDVDTQDKFMTWSVSGNDSITVTIDPITHKIQFCAPSITFEGEEIITLIVSDGVNTDSMDVKVTVYGAHIINVFTMLLFRNPMQGDFMDIYLSSDRELKDPPSLEIRVTGDTTAVTMEAVSDSLWYYHGSYLLPYDASLGFQNFAEVLAHGMASTGQAIEDTLTFAYGRLGVAGGKIALGSVTVTVSEGAISGSELLTLVRNETGTNAAEKSAVHEVSFEDEAYTLGPAVLSTKIPMDISFTVCCRSDGAGIYRFGNDGWEFIGSVRSNNLIHAETSRGGTYRLGYDRIPPTIRLIDSEEGRIAFSAADYGSGIDVNSVQVKFEDRMLECIFDPEMSAFIVRLTDITDKSDILLEVSLSDRVGNKTVSLLGTTVESLPERFIVEQNVPNPFNPFTTITFITGSDQKVTIEIYDILGRKVRVLADEFFTAGKHRVIWNARDDHGRTVSSGTYLYRVVSGSHCITRKMVFIR